MSFVGGRSGERFHADQEQVEDIERAVAAMPGARVEILPAELDVSGGLPLERRPTLLAAVEGVERGQFAGIIVSYLSRLGRNVREQLRAWDRVEAAGGRIIVVREGIDTSTPTGRLQRLLLLGIAEHEREQHVERFDERTRRATESGIWQRRQTPLGYTLDPQTRRLVPSTDAPRVRAAFRDRAAGIPIVRVAEQLAMTSSGARQLLRNRVYLGELHVGRYVNAAAHEPLVTPEEWEAAQVSVARPARTSRREPALLAGLARCQGCGHVMSRTTTARVVYACHGRSSAGRCPQPAAVTAELLDEHVGAIVRRQLERLQISSARAGGRVEEAQKALDAAEAELRIYLEAVSAADVGAEAFADGARQRRAAVDAARHDLRRAISLRPVAPEFDTGADAWQALSASERNQLLRALLEVVIVRRAGGRGARTPLADRVRVIAHGTGFPLPRPVAGEATGIFPLHFPDTDDEGVLGMPSREDRPQHASRAG